MRSALLCGLLVVAVACMSGCGRGDAELAKRVAELEGVVAKQNGQIEEFGRFFRGERAAAAIAATNIYIMDEHGTEAGRLYADAEAASLDLQRGKIRAGLSVVSWGALGKDSGNAMVYVGDLGSSVGARLESGYARAYLGLSCHPTEGIPLKRDEKAVMEWLERSEAGSRGIEASVSKSGETVIGVQKAGKHRLRLGVDKDGAGSLRLCDKDGKGRAVLGCTELVTIKTGEETKRAESSLVLFDKEGKVIFQAP